MSVSNDALLPKAAEPSQVNSRELSENSSPLSREPSADAKDMGTRLDEAKDWMTSGLGDGKFAWRAVGILFGMDFDPKSTAINNFGIVKESILRPNRERKNSLVRHSRSGLIDKKGRDKFMVEDLTVGPAVPMAFRANIIVWTFFLFMVFFSKHCITVDEFGLANPPQGLYLLVCILMFVVVITLALFCEAYAALYVLPTRLIYLGNLKLFDCLEVSLADVSFNVWMATQLFMSLLMHTDIYTTAIFIGRVIVSTDVCKELELHWRTNIDNSLWKHVPFIRSASFKTLTIFAAFVMLLQLVYALGYSVPLSPDISVHAKITTSWPKYAVVEKVSLAAIYNTLFRRKAGHGRCCAALAESGRMWSLKCHDDDYIKGAEVQWDCVSVHEEMWRANVRFVFFLLQNIFIANFQVFFLGVRKAVSNEGADWFTITSVTLTVFLSFKYCLYEIFAHKKHAQHCAKAIDLQRSRAEALEVARCDPDKQHELHLSPNKLHWEATKIEWTTRWAWAINVLFSLLSSVALAYLLVKTVMTMFVCPGGPWSLRIPLQDGCLNLSHTMASCASNVSAFNNSTFWGVSE